MCEIFRLLKKRLQPSIYALCGLVQHKGTEEQFGEMDCNGNENTASPFYSQTES